MARRFFMILFQACAAAFVFCIIVNCGRPATDRMQGYVEGEFVYVASPFAGQLKQLRVRRGGQVKAGDPLFTLENDSEKDARDEAERRMAQARANLEDVKKGKRPSEIEAIEAQHGQAKAALELSDKELARQERLLLSNATAPQDVDRARSARDQERHRIAQLDADLKTAKLGARSDQIAEAEANLRATEAALMKAEWALSQKRQISPEAGLVFDTLYREGEWVAAGRPVVALLPPQNIKVRAFVPETKVSRIHPGDRVRVFVDGLREPISGTVTFVSPEAEYTPPVIYSRESRDKLVFMTETVFDPKTAASLHPGQPVDVQFGF
jgi:HlyD family secretion protein